MDKFITSIIKKYPKLKSNINGQELYNLLDRQLRISYYTPEFNFSILNKKILVLGVGGNGTHVALALVRIGFSEITIVDKDIVDASNLTRQILYKISDIGKNKAKSAEKALLQNNICSNIKSYSFDILENRKKTAELIKKADFVYVLLDSLQSRWFTGSVCQYFKKKYITGGTDILSGLVTQIETYCDGNSPCSCCNALSKIPPKEWECFYTYKGTVTQKPTPQQYSIIKTFNDRIKLPIANPSCYFTVCIGSNIMVSRMINCFMDKQMSSERIIFNIKHIVLWKEEIKTNNDCLVCGK